MNDGYSPGGVMPAARYTVTAYSHGDHMSLTTLDAGCPSACDRILSQAEVERLVKADAWDECLDVIERHELNTAQAREGNPYRTEIR